MPVSRPRLAGVRAATALLELLVLAVIPSLLIPLVTGGFLMLYAAVAIIERRDF